MFIDSQAEADRKARLEPDVRLVSHQDLESSISLGPMA